MDTLYQEQILEHASSPHNQKVMDDCTCSAKGNNPSCGDTATLYIKVDGQIVKDATFTGTGCAISTASISMLTDMLKDMPIADVKKIMPGDIYKMLGISITPTRVNCALLSYRALEQILIKYDIIQNKYVRDY